MTSFGKQLKRERESRGVSVKEIAESTKIGSGYLTALENNDFATLPGRVFSKGYVRAYADYLGIDPDPLVEAYAREEQAQEEDGKIVNPDLLDGLRQAVPARSPMHGSGGIHWGLVLGGAAILVLALVGWWTLRPGTESSPPSAPRVASEPKAQTSPSAEPPADPPVTSEQPAPRQEPEPAKTAPARQTKAVEEPKPAAPRPVSTAPVVAEPATNLEPPTIAIPEFGVGSEVVNRKLEGKSDRFVEGSRVWFWTRVVGGGPDRPISHVWLRDGRVVDTIELKIGASHWRTYSRETLRLGSVGPWAVEARDTEGRVLAREEFLCIPEGSNGSELATGSENETTAS